MINRKRLSFVLPAVVIAVLAVFAAMHVFAAGGVETPMIPIGDTFATVKLESDAEGMVYCGDDVLFTTSVTDIDQDGFSSISVKYTYSAGLTFNNDVEVIGLPTGWQVSEPENANNSLSFIIWDESNSNPVYTELNFTFSFSADALSGNELSVNLLDLKMLDSDGITVSRVSRRMQNCKFTTAASVPNINNIGASLRINNTPAVRFGALVPKDEFFTRNFSSGEYVYSDDANVKFGMLLIEESKLDGELTVNTPGVSVEIFKEAFSSNSNEIMFVCTVNNVSDYTKNYVFCPFVMYRETDDGEYSYHYSDAKTRSARSIAEAELISEVSTKKIEMLKKFTD